MTSDLLFDVYLALFIDGGRTLANNLTIAAAGRVIFLVFFLVDRIPLIKGRSPDHATARESWPLSAPGWAWFVAKEALFLFIGSLHLILAVILLAASLMLAGLHAIVASRRSAKNGARVIGFLAGGFLLVALPALALLATAYMTLAGTDANAPAYVAGISVAIACIAGRQLAGIMLSRRGGRQAPVEAAIRLAKRSFSKKVPTVMKAVLGVALVVLPAGLYLGVDAAVGVSRTTTFLEMSDGVMLGTDVYIGRGTAGPRPVILIRTPYDKGDMYVKVNRGIFDFVRQGYAVVKQDVRGRFSSNGSYIPFLNDQADGAATVAWIKDQTWCDGNIATWGGSADAITHYCFADESSGALKFQTLVAGTPELYDHVMFQGGAFRKSLVESWMYSVDVSNRPRRASEYDDAISWLFANPVKDAAWNSTSLSMNDRYASVKASALHIGGWYDIFSQGTLDGFSGYNYQGGTGAAGKQRLVMWPIGHGKFGELKPVFNGATTLAFPAADDSLHRHWETEMREAAVRGKSIDWSSPSVAYYLMGDVDDPGVDANKWCYATQWPVPATSTPFYLNGSSSALGATVPASNVNVSYLYDPLSPVPTRGGNNLVQIASLELDALGFNNYPNDPDPNRVEQLVGIGPYDQARTGILQREDVVIFSSSVLAAPLTVVGRVRASLWIASNCTDTAFTVMLLDEYPDGRSYNILDGILVTRARDGYNVTAADLVAGQAYNIDIDLWSTAYQFNAGHRIKIAISSSNYPRFERHPNHSGPLTNHPAGFLVASNSILCGGAFNSSIILPVVVP